MVGLFLVVSLGVLVAVVVSAVQRRSRLQPLWARAAADLGLAPPSGGPLADPSISGRAEGRQLTVRERSDDSSNWIAYELAILRDLPAGLTIGSEHLGSRMPVVGKLFSGGREQIETGDTAFDAAFIVTGVDPDHVRSFLTDERRAALVRLARDCPGFRLKNGELTYRFNGRSEKIDDLARPAHAMVAAARVLSPSGAGSATGRGPAAAADPTADGQVFPRPGQPLPSPSGAPAHVEEPEVAPLGAPSLAAAPPRPDGAASPKAEAGVVFPAAESGAWSDMASAMSLTDAATAIADDADDAGGSAVAGAEVLAPDGHLDGPEDSGGAGAAGDQASELSAILGVSAGVGAAVFEERLRGRRVRWTGTVERAGRYDNDLDLGAGPGIRAVIDLGPVDTGTYGVARVAAIVALPVDAVVTAGEPLRFEGTVVSLDHFARRVVITDARPVAG